MVSLYYVDTSAAVKLLVDEAHSKAFAAFYDENNTATWSSSALLRIEVMRAVTRVWPTLAPDAHDLLRAFAFINMDDEIVDAATREPSRTVVHSRPSTSPRPGCSARNWTAS